MLARLGLVQQRWVIPGITACKEASTQLAALQPSAVPAHVANALSSSSEHDVGHVEAEGGACHVKLAARGLPWEAGG